MSLFDISIINKRVVMQDARLGTITFATTIQDNVVKTSLDIMLWQGEYDESSLGSSISYMYTRIFDNKLELDDFISTRKNQGNGRLLFSYLLQILITINTQYPIYRIHGYFSIPDSNHWNMLYHFYNTLYKCCPKQIASLDFQFQNYSHDYFIQHMEELIEKKQNIPFNIYITYL